MQELRVDFITNQAPHYRLALWRRLIEDRNLDVRFLFGEGAGTTIRAIDFSRLPSDTSSERLQTVRNFYLKGVLVWQRGVVQYVKQTDARVLVLLGQMYVLSMWVVAWKARRRGIRVLFWGHGAYGREGRIKRWFRARFLGLADLVLVYGEHARNLLIADGMHPGRIQVVYNSLDHGEHVGIRRSLIDPAYCSRQSWFEQRSAPVLLFVGRLTEQKSLHHLIEAVIRLRVKGRIFNLVFVGDGPERQRLESQAQAIRGQVYFHGACYDERELGRMIANADLCVSPGEVGLTAIHCLSFGTPVCTHDDMASQMPEAEAIVDGRTGVLFERGSMDIARAIERWFEAVPCREAVRGACYREIDEKWNTENQARIMTDAIRSICGEPT